MVLMHKVLICFKWVNQRLFKTPKDTRQEVYVYKVLHFEIFDKGSADKTKKKQGGANVSRYRDGKPALTGSETAP